MRLELLTNILQHLTEKSEVMAEKLRILHEAPMNVQGKRLDLVYISIGNVRAHARLFSPPLGPKSPSWWRGLGGKIPS